MRPTGHSACNAMFGPQYPRAPLRGPLFSRQCQSASLATHLKLFSKQCPSASRTRFHNGARRRNRTANLLLTGQALYLLSYTGKNGRPSTSLAGAVGRNRTANPRLTGASLSRLSYGGVVACPSCLVEPAGLEPAYHLLAGQVLSQLSYGPSQAAWITACEFLSGFREAQAIRPAMR